MVYRHIMELTQKNIYKPTMEIQIRTLASISAGNKFIAVALNSNSLKIQNFQIRSMHGARKPY